jgi:hypothetical protein
MLGENILTSIAVEMLCNKHGFERFRVKIVRKFNMPPNVIVPELSRRPTVGEIKCIYVGREVNPKEVEQYLVNYFREKGMLQNIVKMHIIT